jgi:hypothetical protein
LPIGRYQGYEPDPKNVKRNLLTNAELPFSTACFAKRIFPNQLVGMDALFILRSQQIRWIDEF